MNTGKLHKAFRIGCQHNSITERMRGGYKGSALAATFIACRRNMTRSLRGATEAT
jgi:hypothetical protein